MKVLKIHLNLSATMYTLAQQISSLTAIFSFLLSGHNNIMSFHWLKLAVNGEISDIRDILGIQSMDIENGSQNNM